MDSLKFRLRSLVELALAAMRHQEIKPARDSNVISRSNSMLRGSPALLRVFLALSVAMFAVSPKSAAPRQQFNLGESGQSDSVIRTERKVYLAGETVNVSGSNFSPYERVGLRVTHANGTTEANMGHEMWWINADVDGTFQAT